MGIIYELASVILFLIRITPLLAAGSFSALPCQVDQFRDLDLGKDSVCCHSRDTDENDQEVNLLTLALVATPRIKIRLWGVILNI